MKNKLLYLLVALFLACPVSYARMQTLQDAALQYDFYNRDTKIHKDGTHESIVEIQITLLREQAREFVAKYTMGYNSDSSSVQILEAKTIFQGKEYKVTDGMIEDKPVANNRAGFDEIKQIAISFPKPEVGATIYLKYKEITNKVLIDKEFFAKYAFGTGGYWKKSNVTINSEIPLLVELNDPYKKLLLTTENPADKKGYFHKINLKLLSPLINMPINEVAGSALNHKRITYVSLASLDKWSNLGDKLAVKYNEVLEQSLPDVFLDIAKAAEKEGVAKKEGALEKEEDIVARINKITTMLSKKVQYCGDWRSINGRLVPQDLAKVAEKQLGDCKDFSTITVKILRHLGYEAHVALVLRGAGMQAYDEKFPSMSNFNHAILKVISKGGKTYWIDPTNVVSMADGIFPDIAGKSSLVLARGGASYEEIPDVAEAHAKTIIVNAVSLDNVGSSNIQLLGEDAMSLTGARLYASAQHIEDWVFKNFFSVFIPKEARISSSIPNLNSRVVTPITISLGYKNPSMFHKTNIGLAYRLEGGLSLGADMLDMDIKGSVNDLYLGNPRTMQRTTIFKNNKIRNLKELNFNFSSAHLTLARECVIKGEDSIITDKMITHKAWMENSYIKSAEFKKLQDIFRENRNISVVMVKDE
ncbi:MAG: hypothetical protein COA94_01375 [Rickettsiales bacterium]|nr:MAG: hypothetical protein COA94_01375 [Rickettsiales bacterium]